MQIRPFPCAVLSVLLCGVTCAFGQEAPRLFQPPASDLLTAADVVGPDGLIYPDFSRAGHGGKFTYPERVIHVDELGATPDDNESDSDAVDAALAQARESGGAIIEFGEGTYHLTRPVLIDFSNCVVRGAGREDTLIKFAYDLPDQSVNFFRPKRGELLTRNSIIEVHSDPHRLKHHLVYANDTLLFKRGADTSGGQRFSLVATASKIPSSVSAGPVTLRAVVERFDGTRTEETMEIEYDPSATIEPGKQCFSHSVGAFMFLGDHFSNKYTRVSVDSGAMRGSDTVVPADDHQFEAGQWVLLEGKADAEWLKHTNSARKDFDPRVMLQIAAVDGNMIQFTQPLRMAFPGKPHLFRVWPVENVGIEKLTFEQTEKQWIDALMFECAAFAQVKDIEIKRSGRNPIALGMAKFSEVRDSRFGAPFFSGGGGTGYLGFAGTWDSLMENLECVNLRHAPVFQDFASGNVIRKSRFTSSDVNYHMLWAHENLMEQCTLDAKRGTGSYGYAVFAQKPEVHIHGPGGGPRNIVYNNRFKSPRPGVYLGGSNDKWIIAHNVFEVEAGPGMIFRNRSTNHTIWNNVVKMQDRKAAAFVIEDDASTGLAFVGNRVSGAKELFDAAAEPGRDDDNKLDGFMDDPEPQTPSIYEWQRNQTKSADAE